MTLKYEEVNPLKIGWFMLMIKMVIAVVSDKSLNYYKVFSGKHLPNTFEITNTMLKQSYPNMFVYIH